ncbi:MAG: plasmid stabilization protein [Flavobacteriales bacterium]|nr:plasmid stabilization protein [Flavobacteriales bacterium]
MILKIIWSEFAEKQLDEIYEYYQKNASPRIAKMLLKEIINELNKLIHSPLIGQEEELLKQREILYRYLVFKNYKLIYSVDIENGYIKITDVFDTRQNPQKIKRTKRKKLRMRKRVVKNLVYSRILD